MEGQELGGRSFGRPGNLLQSELVGLSNVGVISRQEGYSLAAPGGFQPAPHLCMPSRHAAALVSGLQHGRGGLDLEQGRHADGRARIVGTVPPHVHQIDRRRHVHGNGPPVGYQNRMPINTSLGGSQHMYQRSTTRAIAPQTATCISRSPVGNMPMLACTSGPYPMPVTFQSDAPNSLLRQGGMQAVPRPIAMSGSNMCNTYQHFPEQLGGEHGRILDGIQMQPLKGHMPVSTHLQTAGNTVSIVGVSGAPLVSKTPNQSNLPYSSAVLVRDDTGMYQLVNTDKKTAHQDINTVNFVEAQRPVLHGSRPHNGDFSQGNPRHARSLSFEMRGLPKNLAWETHVQSHKNHFQHKSANHQQYHPQLQSSPGMGFKPYPRDDNAGINVPICIETDSQDDVSNPPATPPARRKEDVIEMDLEDTCEPRPDSPVPSPPAVDIADQSLSEADVVLAAQSLKELSKTVPSVKVSENTHNDNEGRLVEDYRYDEKEKKGAKGHWNPLDLLLDAAARMENEMLELEKFAAERRNCVPVAESSTRMKSKRMRGTGYRKSHVYSAVLNHTYREESNPPRSFQTFEGLRGVTSTRSGKFIARCRYRGSAVQIGVFNCARDASKAYDRFILALRGPTAATNHPSHDYLEFEVSNARSAFEQMCENVRECPRIRKASCHVWLKEAKRFKFDENKPRNSGGQETFDSQVMSIEAVLSQMEFDNPEAFQIALERVRGCSEDSFPSEILLETTAHPWSLLRHIGEKRLCLEDALSFIQEKIEENCKGERDNSNSDRLLCAADMLAAITSVWKVWKDGSLSWSSPRDCKIQDASRNASRNEGDHTFGNRLSKRSKLYRNRAIRNKKFLGGLASMDTKHRGCPYPKGSEEDSPKCSKFLHHLRNDIHSHLEDTNLDDREKILPKRRKETLDLRDESDVSSKPSSWDDLRVESRDAKRPIIISGGRVRGCRPAPRRGTGRKAASGRIQSNQNSLSHPSGEEFDRSLKGVRKRKALNGYSTRPKKECMNQRRRQAGSSSENATKNWAYARNQFSEVNTEGITGSRSGGSRDSIVHVNVSEVQLTAEVAVHNERFSHSAAGNRILPCSTQLESDADSLGGRDYNGVAHMEDIQFTFGGRSLKSNQGSEQDGMQAAFDDFDKPAMNTALYHDGNQSASYGADKDHENQYAPSHTEEGMVRIYGSQLAVQQLNDAEVEDKKNVSSIGKHEAVSNQAIYDVSIVDSVQWTRLLASALWPKKRGGGMLHKAFNPNCSGLRYRDAMLELRKQMYKSCSNEGL